MPKLDLNLLRHLGALLSTRSVSRSAELLHVSQPVMSQALSRLRTHFDDPLLIRQGNTYIRTPLGETLLPLVNEALTSVEIAEDIKSTFSGASSKRTFVVAASDYAATTVLGSLRKILAVEAPGIGIEVITASGRSAHRLDFANCDLVIGVTGYSLPGVSDTLFTDDFVAIVGAENPILNQDTIDIRDIANLPNATAYFGDEVATPVDRVFEDLSIQRNVVAQVSGYLALPHLVESTDLVAFVPRILAKQSQKNSSMVILEMPQDARGHIVEVMYWPPARDAEPASIWLRNTLNRACSDISSSPDPLSLQLTNIPSS